MDRPARIAVANFDDRTLLAELRTLPSRPETRSFDSLYESVDAIVAFRPDLLFVGGGADVEDLPGALRLLRSLLPGLTVLLVVPAAHEVENTPLAQRAGARLLVWPPQPGELAGVLERAISGSDRPRDEVFLDLARGFADEINNPLLFLTGHLQLLQARLSGHEDRDLRDQVGAALGGAHRIQASVERIRMLSRAAAGPRRTAEVDVQDVVAAAIARAAPRDPVEIAREPQDTDSRVQGDPDLLTPALELFANVALEIRALGLDVRFVVSGDADHVRLRLHVAGKGLRDWRLPRSYEPYYLNRLLRGSSQGLSLFLVQTTVHAHRGQATARRLPDESLALDVMLPRHRRA